MPLEDVVGGEGGEGLADVAGSGTGDSSTGGDGGLPAGDSAGGADHAGGDRGSDSEGDTGGGDGPARSMGKDDPISAAARKTYRDLTKPEDKPRKENGQFKKGAPQKAAAKLTQSQPNQGAQQQQPQQPQQPKQPGVVDPNRVPDSWRGEAKAKWATVDPVVRAEINKREADYRNGHARLTQEIEASKHDVAFSRSLGEVVTPFLPGLQAKGVNIQAAIQDATKLVSVLHLGSNEDRVSALRQLVKAFGIQIPKPGDAAAQAQPNQAQPQPQPAQQPQPQVLRDPRVDALLAEREQAQQRAQQEARAQIESTVNDFTSDPAHEHFGLVYEDMARLIETGMAKDIKDAYDKAVRLNPTAFAAVQSKQEQQRREEAARIAAEARRAAGAPRSSGKPAHFQPAQPSADPKDKRNDIIASAVRGYVSKFGR